MYPGLWNTSEINIDCSTANTGNNASVSTMTTFTTVTNVTIITTVTIVTTVTAGVYYGTRGSFYPRLTFLTSLLTPGTLL